MNMGYSFLELSTDASSSDGGCELSSSSSDSHDVPNVRGVFADASSSEAFEEREQPLHPGDDNDAIPVCAGLGREQ
jgi:hypothetical protein